MRWVAISNGAISVEADVWLFGWLASEICGCMRFAVGIEQLDKFWKKGFCDVFLAIERGCLGAGLSGKIMGLLRRDRNRLHR